MAEIVSVGELCSGVMDRLIERGLRWQSLKIQHPKNSWEAITQYYEFMNPEIRECGDTLEWADPYPWFDWHFTPIEYCAWNVIRTWGPPLYPQYPANGCFIDFGNPTVKVGLELDGKEFHQYEKDMKRDTMLAEHGWHIYRVTGSDSYKDVMDQVVMSIKMVYFCTDRAGDFHYNTLENYKIANFSIGR